MAYFDRRGNEIDQQTWVRLDSDLAYRLVKRSDCGSHAVLTIWRGMDPYAVHLTGPANIFETLPFVLSETGHRLLGSDRGLWRALAEEQLDAPTEEQALEQHAALVLRFSGS